MTSKCSIVFLNKRKEFEEYDILSFAEYVAGRLVRRFGSLEIERDDLVQDACLAIWENRDKLEKKPTNYAYVCVYSDVFDSARNRLRFNRKAKVAVVPDDYIYFKKRRYSDVGKEEFETIDLLEGSMDRACVSTKGKELFRRYVDEPKGFFKRENIEFNTPEHYRFVTDRRRISEAVADEMGIPMPEKRGRV